MDEPVKQARGNSAANAATGPASGAAAAQAAGLKRVRWDSKNMTSTFANVVNAQMSREEFHLFFGTNQTWNVQDSEELVVDLAGRIVLTPHGAKRLLLLLQARIEEYEKNFGKISI